jgi:hypothetical protein
VGSNPVSGSNKCGGCVISNSFISIGGTGVEVTDAMEGCFILGCNIQGVTYGVKADYCIQLTIHDTHINANFGSNRIGVYATGTGGGCDQANITGCLIYAENTGNVTCIKGSFTRTSIVGNTFIGFGATGSQGVNLTGGDATVIASNVFYKMAVNYFELGAGTSNVLATPNVFSSGGTTPTNNFIDSGTANSTGTAANLGP